MVKDEWIPVDVQLPPEGVMVLVTCESKKGIRSVNRAYYSDGFWHGSGSMAGVTAWMEMPLPYKKGR
ncbi:MAG: DUF551 domain-containing protein [Firmicutes bacterium]|nr:DUF551 domain-containing protein [Bacillota bacterium]